MKKNIKILLVFLIIFFLAGTLSSCGPKDYEIYIFTELSECYALEDKQSEEIQITVYDSPEKDKDLRNLAYIDFYACNYSSSELQFDLFAYEFPTQETAKKYFKNATGIESTKTTNFLGSSGLSRYQLTVIKDNLAYTFHTRASDEEKATSVINQLFSEKIIEVKWS